MKTIGRSARGKRTAVSNSRKSKLRKYTVTATVFLTLVAVFAVAYYNIPALHQKDINGTVLKGILDENVVLPQAQGALKVSQGDVYVFDIYVEYKDKNGNTAAGEISDKSELNMDFSNTSVCDRTAYNTIQFKSNAPNGTILRVTLEYEGQKQIFQFIIAAALDSTVGADGVLTNPSDPAVLVTSTRNLPSDYVPKGMTQPNVQFKSGVGDAQKYLCSEAAIAAEKMFTTAKNDGMILTALKGFSGYSAADPEHQTGLALDVSSVSVDYSVTSKLAGSVQGQWLAENAYKFGFVLRYPSGKEGVTGFAYSPAHLRYVGVELATYLYENNLTLDELYAR